MHRLQHFRSPRSASTRPNYSGERVPPNETACLGHRSVYGRTGCEVSQDTVPERVCEGRARPLAIPVPPWARVVALGPSALIVTITMITVAQPALCTALAGLLLLPVLLRCSWAYLFQDLRFALTMVRVARKARRAGARQPAQTLIHI
ncbi:hypothetical protein AAES_68363 [Amazona aestiva]|uniref:Uncharacterized protein n=1 Tax=Amazona aestiva TaxID=12930 RepID=A0A0Q3TPY7_AMAAE|nr:hypothetical protein AAES_68363 [Amazona aestiva]